MDHSSRPLKDGEPCSHPGCSSHISHPCEGCGRIGARGEYDPSWLDKLGNQWENEWYDSPIEQRAKELGLKYHYLTESYDRTVCTGRNGKWAVPIYGEWTKTNQYAKYVLAVLEWQIGREFQTLIKLSPFIRGVEKRFHKEYVEPQEKEAAQEDNEFKKWAKEYNEAFRWTLRINKP